MGTILIVFFVMQVLVIGGILIFLRRSLNRDLAEEAVHKFEILYTHELPAGTSEIVVVVKEDLPEALRQRILQSIHKKFGQPLELVVVADAGIRGGLIIKAGSLVIDGSLSSRLKQSGMLKTKGTNGH